MQFKLNSLGMAIRVELAKLMKSWLILLITVGFIFLLLIKRGETWPLLLQNALYFYTSLIGLVGFGILSSWLFAREYSDGVFKDLLALPITRRTIIIAKIVVFELAAFLIAGLCLISTFVVGLMLEKTILPFGLLGHFTQQVIKITFWDLLLAFLWPLLASVWQSTLLPTSLSFLTVIISVVFASQPIGRFIPWAIPGYYLANNTGLTIVSSLLLALVASIGLWGTCYVWTQMDQE